METEEYEIQEDGTKIPIIYVTRDKYTDFCKFWCRYCNKWHQHGQGDGHRSAHCWDSPYSKTGYILKTKSGIGKYLANCDYIIHCYNINQMNEITINLSIENENYNKQLAEKLLNYYFDKDYFNTTLCALELLGEDISEGYLDDLQEEGDGIPDFMYCYKVPSFKDYYVEFKSETDALRMNQLSKFIQLSKQFRVLIIYIEKRGKNGAR